MFLDNLDKSQGPGFDTNDKNLRTFFANIFPDKDSNSKGFTIAIMKAPAGLVGSTPTRDLLRGFSKYVVKQKFLFKGDT